MKKELRNVSFKDWEDYIKENNLKITYQGMNSHCIVDNEIVAKEVHGFVCNEYYIKIDNNQYMLNNFTNIINNVSN